MLVSTLAAFTLILAASASPLEVKREEFEPTHAVPDAWLGDVSNTTMLVIGSSFYAKESVNDLDKRDCIPKRYSENNVDHTETAWSNWAKVCGCLWNEKSSGTASMAFQTSQTITKTVSGGFDFGLASPEDIAKTINGNFGLNFGYSWSTSKTTAFTFTCNINAHDRASVWQRNRIGKANTAQRSCSKGCGEGTWCSDWKFGRIEFPLTGSQTNTELGCSSGVAAQC